MTTMTTVSKMTVKAELSRAKTSQAKLGWTDVADRCSDLQPTTNHSKPMDEPNPSAQKDPVDLCFLCRSDPDRGDKGYLGDRVSHAFRDRSCIGWSVLQIDAMLCNHDLSCFDMSMSLVAIVLFHVSCLFSRSQHNCRLLDKVTLVRRVLA